MKKRTTLFDYVEGEGCEVPHYAASVVRIVSERSTEVPGVHVGILDEPELQFGEGSSPLPRDVLRLKPFSHRRRISGRALLIFPNTEGGIAMELKKFLEQRASRLSSNLELDVIAKPSNDVTDDVVHSLRREGEHDLIIALTGWMGETDKKRIKCLALLRRKPVQVVNVSKFGRKRQQGGAALTAYLNNLLVQIYAKLGGVPWILSRKVLGKDKRVFVGIAFVRIRETEAEEIFAGFACIASEFGARIHFLALPPFALPKPVKGLYLPEPIMAEFVEKLVKLHGAKQFILYKTSPLHEEERRALLHFKGLDWTFIHIKRDEPIKRLYDLDTDDAGVMRGTFMIDVEQRKILLFTTGKVKYVTQRGVKIKNHYLGTPVPIELSVAERDTNCEDHYAWLKALATYTLALGKLDWEAATRWPKVPAVVKYSRKAARILSPVIRVKEKIPELLPEIVEVRYLM